MSRRAIVIIIAVIVTAALAGAKYKTRHQTESTTLPPPEIPTPADLLETVPAVTNESVVPEIPTVESVKPKKEKKPKAENKEKIDKVEEVVPLAE
jgi:hypothetical protein